jgi:hypothetical protein
MLVLQFPCVAASTAESPNGVVALRSLRKVDRVTSSSLLPGAALSGSESCRVKNMAFDPVFPPTAQPVDGLLSSVHHLP